MNLVDRLAEARIEEAIERGDFDGLPGAGQPIVLEDDALVPPELRAAYRLLKNANCLPPELAIRGEIKRVESLLAAIPDGPRRTDAERKLSLLRARVEAAGGDLSPALEEADYRARVHRRLG